LFRGFEVIIVNVLFDGFGLLRVMRRRRLGFNALVLIVSAFSTDWPCIACGKVRFFKAFIRPFQGPITTFSCLFFWIFRCVL